MPACDRIAVLNFGTLSRWVRRREIQANRTVLDIYLSGDLRMRCCPLTHHSHPHRRVADPSRRLDRGRPRRGRRYPRLERRRQDQPAARRHGPVAAGVRCASCSTAWISRGCRRMSRNLRGLGYVPEGRRDLRHDDGAREPRARRLRRRPAAGEDAGGDRRDVRAVSDLARAGRRRRQHAERRPAADAGDRPRADVPARAAPARRAVARPGAADGADGARHDPHAAPESRPRCCWSSRTQGWPCRSPIASI